MASVLISFTFYPFIKYYYFLFFSIPDRTIFFPYDTRSHKTVYVNFPNSNSPLGNMSVASSHGTKGSHVKKLNNVITFTNNIILIILYINLSFLSISINARSPVQNTRLTVRQTESAG
jgi:hypothetical protein